ncbi:raffinose/stachyose/melibiose transport system permease protein [Paenibacillus shirakamiensis]|uniref:Raffinose/stachyose/melibiose transport system permease protein n=1 Tax=Paenibacillus shirakamiensis TaxID=1265935 RepID=A0ABS4JES9_9BACL|nr:sugar ABC transporter permease [Paenibacillus shirakamiensis]MBP2000203.1 raffinose/stachyose/melibiose transport system permease protein [Paenibacillus shirakamiensis]
MQRKLGREFQYSILIIPALIFYVLFCVYPFLTMFYYSVTDYSVAQMTNLSFIGFENYTKVFDNDLLMAGFKNSLLYAILMTVFQTALGIILAVFLDRKLATKNILRSVFFLPAVFSPLVIGFLWNYLMSTSDFGLINRGLNGLGLDKINFLGDANLALYSVVLTQLWQWTGWAMVIFLANLQGISKDLYEAAEIDGASSWKKFWKVTLPLLQPSVNVVAVTAMIGGLKVFDIIMALTDGGPGNSTQTIMTAYIKTSFTEGAYNEGAASGVVFFVVVMIITLVMMKLLGKWGRNIQ